MPADTYVPIYLPAGVQLIVRQAAVWDVSASGGEWTAKLNDGSAIAGGDCVLLELSSQPFTVYVSVGGLQIPYTIQSSGEVQTGLWIALEGQGEEEPAAFAWCEYYCNDFVLDGFSLAGPIPDDGLPFTYP